MNESKKEKSEGDQKIAPMQPLEKSANVQAAIDAYSERKHIHLRYLREHNVRVSFYRKPDIEATTFRLGKVHWTTLIMCCLLPRSAFLPKIRIYPGMAIEC